MLFFADAMLLRYDAVMPLLCCVATICLRCYAAADADKDAMIWLYMLFFDTRAA